MSRVQHRPKSLASSSLSTQAIPTISRSDKPTTRSSQKTPLLVDAISDRATLSLIRRTLCSQLGEKGRNTPAPIDEILPPLTSSNEVDLQLYAFIAITIREFVQTWYSKITPDQIFVEEVVKIIAHCTRAMEQRLRKVDLESLLFDELPEVLEVHIHAYRTAQTPLHPPPFRHDPRHIYHSLWPFAALTPIPDEGINIELQLENEATYRQLLVQGILAVLLPTEDLENECLTALVGQIFSEMILGGGIGGKASEPWLLWEGITKIAECVQAQLPNSKARVRLERSNSGVGTIRSTQIRASTKGLEIGKSVQKYFWLLLQYGFLVFTAVRFLVFTIATASSLPSRTTPMAKFKTSATSIDHMEKTELTMMESTSKEQGVLTKQPILLMKIWSCVASLVDMNTRMPWLSGTLSMLQWGAVSGPGRVGNTNGMVDKVLSHFIQKHVLDPTLLPTLLRTTRAALFPNNTLAPARAIPTAAQQLLIRRRCAETLLALIPAKVQDVYFGAGMERRMREVEDVLDIFSDAYCNKHLLYGVVELIIVRLIPELGEKGVEGLLEERLSY